MFHKARGGLCPGEGDERTMRAGEFARNCLLTCEETRENHTRIQNDVARVVLCRGGTRAEHRGPAWRQRAPVLLSQKGVPLMRPLSYRRGTPHVMRAAWSA
jgi:hypothetical protein